MTDQLVQRQDELDPRAHSYYELEARLAIPYIAGQVMCYALCQTGGVAAAVSAQMGASPRRVSVHEVQRTLRKQNVYRGGGAPSEEICIPRLDYQ